MVKIHEAISNLTQSLMGKVSNPRLEAELLVSFALKKDKLQLIIHKEETLSAKDAMLIESLSKKRISGIPLAYITGTKEFMSLEFTVNENVLIPRPETEELVSYIIDSHSSSETLNILDLCTGSGAICCSLAYYIKHSRCTGADIDKNALKTAKINAENLGVIDRCRFFEGNVLEKINTDTKYDVVVSNPPYIETSVIPTLDEGVKNFEPIIALDGGEDGLIFYRAIIQNIEYYLKDGGMLYFEIGYNQGDSLQEMMNEKFENVRIIKDLAGLDRIACGRLKNNILQLA